MDPKLRNYRRLHSGNGKATIIAIVCLAISSLLIWLISLNFWCVVPVALISAVGYTYIPRTCPTCGKKMKYDFHSGGIPEAYYCSIDGLYIKSGIYNEGSQGDDWGDNNLIK